MLSLPKSLKPLFSTFYEGAPSFQTPSLARATQATQILARLDIPHTLKIRRLRRKHILYVVLLPEKLG